jgi:hypothetical protein
VRAHLLFSLVAVFLLSVPVMAQGLPGTPLSGVNWPPQVILAEPAEYLLPSPLTETYDFPLPGPVVPGDVVLLEPNWGGDSYDPIGWSDVFAFAEMAPDVVTIYSDPTDEVTPICIGRQLIEPVFLGEPLSLPEIVYYQVPGVEYVLISDVPEPTGIAGLLTGLAGCGLLIRRRRST